MKKNLSKWIGLLIVLALVFLAGWFVNRHKSGSNAQATEQATPKQLWTCSMHPQVIQDKPGHCPICHMKLVPLEMKEHATPAPQSDAASHQHKIKYWWDPMIGPSSIRHVPGKSAMGMDLVPVYEDEANAGQTGGSAKELTVDPATVQNMGLRLATVQRGELTRDITAVGYLTVAEPLRYDINLRLSGWIEKLSADTLGMPIKKGQVLFELYSPQLTVGVGELIAARQAKASAGDESSPAGAAADALYQSTRRKLLLWGLPAEQVDQLSAMKTAPQTVPIVSPADGLLMEKDVVEGSALQSGQRVMRIVDQRTLWLDAQIQTQDVSGVHVGQQARAYIDGMPRRTWRGKVIFIDPRVDPLTRTTTARLSIDNTDLKLRPGMFATVAFTLAQGEALLAPRAAIIDTGRRQVAFVAKAKGHFEPRDIQMGAAAQEGMVQVLHGLSAGEKVVVSGQFLLDADSRMREAVRRYLEENHP